MKLIHKNSDGEIVAAVYDADYFKFVNSINVPVSVFEIDEVDPDNKDVCHDIYHTIGRTDSSGLGKYYIDGAGDLIERDGWVEDIGGMI